MYHDKHKLGAIKSPIDFRDYRIASFMSVKKVPDIYSVREKMSPVENQANLGSCVSFGTCACGEYFDNVDLSEMWLYDLCKKNDGIPNEEGTFPRVALKMAQKIGICEEKFWDYIDRYPNNTSPLPGAEENASKHKLFSYAAVDITQLQKALFEFGPLVIALNLYENFMYIEDEGFMPKPKGALLGGHCMCMTGYLNKKNCFGLNNGYIEIKNSWGANFGDRGYVKVPFKYLPMVFMEAWSLVDATDRIASSLRIK
jgi:hypothetical protein